MKQSWCGIVTITTAGIKVIEGKGWKFQFDEELPRDINTVKYIPKGTYHRILKGEGKLVLEIRDMK